VFNDPIIFHLHHSKETRDVNFWSSLAEQVGGPILELGSGTGRLLKPLVDGGHSVIGLDINFPALAYSKKFVDNALLSRIQVFQSSMDQFHLNERFSLIFLACNTLSTLSSRTRINAYKSIHAHLRPGGIFAASLPNPAYLIDIPGEGDQEIEETLLHPTTGIPIQVISSWERSNTSVIFRWHYDQLFADGRVVRDTVETEHKLTSLDEYIAELKAENLNPIQILGDYDHSDYDVNSPFAIILARKEA
jgi:SAM-dependent methyltransferase